MRSKNYIAPRNRFAALASSMLIAAAALFGAASPAAAHDELIHTAGELSEDGSRITLTLSFNNEIMPMGAESVVLGADGTDLADGPLEVSGRDVVQHIVMPGFDETITLAWRVVSSDGHPISNTLAFAVLEREGGTELQFREVPPTPAAENAEGAEAPSAESDPAFEEPVDGLWTPAVLWTIFTIMLIAAVGTSAIVAVKRKNLKNRADEGGEK